MGTWRCGRCTDLRVALGRIVFEFGSALVELGADEILGPLSKDGSCDLYLQPRDTENSPTWVLGRQFFTKAVLQVEPRTQLLAMLPGRGDVPRARVPGLRGDVEEEPLGASPQRARDAMKLGALLALLALTVAVCRASPYARVPLSDVDARNVALMPQEHVWARTDSED
mmetsp:Transcript_95376/g.218465  ORF Transcript_95376/g.218465 Transcript_95376/m.218465 type:complete len:169 (-) Transcript_95376:51-557(-)